MFKTNKQLILAAVALLTGSQALADSPYSSTVSVTSNLLLSGVSISDDHPSVAFATEYTFGNGITLSGKV